MYQKTLLQLESKIKKSKSLNEERKKELLSILEKLDHEVEQLAETDTESAITIANFAQTSTHEAARDSKRQELVDASLQGLKGSIEGFEASHPTLTETVNKLAVLLSNMGI